MNILNQLTIKHMMINKKRTIATIVGVMLSSVLLFGVGICVSTIRKNILNEVIEKNGAQHFTIINYPYSELETLQKMKQLEVNGYYYIHYDGMYEEQVPIKVISKPNISKGTHLFLGEYPKENEILIAKDFANQFHFELQDTIIVNEQPYIISGVYDKDDLISYTYNNHYTITPSFLYINSIENLENMTVKLRLKSVKNAKEQILKIGQSLGFDPIYERGHYSFEEIIINNALLAQLGEVENSGQQAILFLSVLLISTILGIVCILVIYNSFAISVAERKKIFGMFASIGATPRQLLFSIFFEAFMIGIIAIPLGFFLSIGIIQLVVTILNNILEGINDPYQLSLHPQYLFISVVIIIVTLFLSALFPAKRASEISPISALRMQKDIKRKKVHSKWICILFGIEAELAYKNRKRNKRKYRVTTISICVSIVLFLTFSTYIHFFMVNREEEYEPDVSFVIENNSQIKQVVQQIQNIVSTKSSVLFQNLYLPYQKLNDEYYTSMYLSSRNHIDLEYKTMMIYALDDRNYYMYLKKLGLKEEKPIIYNKGVTKEFINGEMVDQYMTVFDETKNPVFHFCSMLYTENGYYSSVDLSNCSISVTDLYFTDISPMTPYSVHWEPGQYMIVNKSMFEKLSQLSQGKEKDYQRIYVNVGSVQKYDKQVQQILKQYSNIPIEYRNSALERYDSDMQILAIRFILYSFILFIALIAVTSVISTIYTSIQLRRVEFAMLRSIGLSPKGLRKMLCFESIFFGISSLFYGLGISFLIIWIIQRIFALSYGPNRVTMPFPTLYIGISIIGVFIIVFLSMYYATKKIRNENIVDAIE